MSRSAIVRSTLLAALLFTAPLLTGVVEAQAQNAGRGNPTRFGPGGRPVTSGNPSGLPGADWRGTAQSGRGAPSPNRSYMRPNQQPNTRPQQTQQQPQQTGQQGRTVSLRELRYGRRGQQITESDRQRMIDWYRNTQRGGEGGGGGGGGY